MINVNAIHPSKWAIFHGMKHKSFEKKTNFCHFLKRRWFPGGKEVIRHVEGLLDVFHEVDFKNGKSWTFGDSIIFSEGVNVADVC